MGSGISKPILKGLYCGDIKVARDLDLLKSYGITHIIAAHELARAIYPQHFTYLCLQLDDGESKQQQQQQRKQAAASPPSVGGGGTIRFNSNTNSNRNTPSPATNNGKSVNNNSNERQRQQTVTALTSGPTNSTNPNTRSRPANRTDNNKLNFSRRATLAAGGTAAGDETIKVGTAVQLKSVASTPFSNGNAAGCAAAALINPNITFDFDGESAQLAASAAAYANTVTLTQCYAQCNTFVHQARKNGGTVLVHCLGGVNRAAAMCTAYVTSCTTVTWRDALYAITASHPSAHPHAELRAQLRKLCEDCGPGATRSPAVEAERQRLWQMWPEQKSLDDTFTRTIQTRQWHWILYGIKMSTDFENMDATTAQNANNQRDPKRLVGANFETSYAQHQDKQQQQQYNMRLNQRAMSKSSGHQRAMSTSGIDNELLALNVDIDQLSIAETVDGPSASLAALVQQTTDVTTVITNAMRTADDGELNNTNDYNEFTNEELSSSAPPGATAADALEAFSMSIPNSEFGGEKNRPLNAISNAIMQAAVDPILAMKPFQVTAFPTDPPAPPPLGPSPPAPPSKKKKLSKDASGEARKSAETTGVVNAQYA